MFRVLVILILLMSLLSVSFPFQADNLNVSSIPPGLMHDADAVVRIEFLRFEVRSLKKATKHIRRVITVLNSNGRHFGELVIPYDRFSKINDLEGAIYSAEGEKLRDLKKSDVKDFSATSHYSLYEDNRVRIAELYYDRYPYTVSFDFNIEYNGLLNWPFWFFERPRASLQEGVLQVVLPETTRLRFWTNNPEAQPRVMKENGKTMYRWNASSLRVFEEEPWGPSFWEQVTTIRLAPVYFQLDDYPGDMSSWKTFGEWYYNLSAGRDRLPNETVEEVNRMTEAKERKEKVRALYEFMQSKTRYVSVQLGIGGWQPFEATYVQERKYGDCKALTNYMVSLLKAVGIPSFPALIRNGNRTGDFPSDFPSNQFNHVILCVPFPSDTVWLECTSQSVPFGHIGSSNENRNTLLVTPHGGVLTRTPKSRSSDNLQIRHANVDLDAEGNGIARVRTVFTGNQQDHIRNGLVEKSAREKVEWLTNALNIPRFRLQDVDFSGIETGDAHAVLSFNLELPRYASVTGTRVFLTPNLMEGRAYVPPPPKKKRKHPVWFAYSYVDIDSVSFNIPSDFRPESIPDPISLQTSFGRYQCSTTFVNGTTLAYTRTFEIKETTLAPEQYEEYRTFLSKIVRSDKAQVVLVKQSRN